MKKQLILQKGITAAQTEYVWLTDDDVQFPESIQLPDLSGSPDLIILPLRMKKGHSLLERLQQTEFAAIQSLTLWTAERGRAVMCSGANLIVNRKQWLESITDLRPDLPSGDDMFLLESFKRRGLRIKCATTPALEIAPVAGLRQLLRQRMRWAGKAPHYTDNDIRLCGALVLCINLLVWLPPVFIAKYIVDCLLIRAAQRFGTTVRNYGWYAFLLSLVYPVYMLICLIGGLFRMHKW